MVSGAIIGKRVGEMFCYINENSSSDIVNAPKIICVLELVYFDQ